jgi:uncharacterized protein
MGTTSQREFLGRYGSHAVVTGAAAGIGAAFAEALAKRGMHLILVDVNDEVEAVGARLAGAHGVTVRCLVGDLVSPEFVEEVARVRESNDVGLLVSNAGIALIGPFLELPLEPQLRALDLHCRASLALAHRFGQPMKARGRGGIILLSSNSAFLHTPFIANYAATKAYTLALAEALYEELRLDGVAVMALAPGMTRTAALLDSNIDLERAKKLIREPSEVAEEALARLGTTPSYVSSAGDRFAAFFFGRLLPAKLSLRLAKRSVRYFYPSLREPKGEDANSDT